MSNYYETYVKEWQKTAKGKYTRQKTNAMKRNIRWDFTFETWWKVWEDSGKWEQRGRKAGQYVMSRYADHGSYHPENVFIQECGQNSSQNMRKRQADKKLIKMEDWVHTNEGMDKYWFSLLGT